MEKISLDSTSEYSYSAIASRSFSTHISVKDGARHIVSMVCIVFSDLVGLSISLFLAYQIRLILLPAVFNFFPTEPPPSLTMEFWWIPGIMVTCFTFMGLYKGRLSFWHETKKLITAISLVFVLIFAGISLGKLSGEVSRTVLVSGYLVALFTIPLSRYFTKTILAKKGIWKEHALILGTGNIAQKIAASLTKDNYMGYIVFGFLAQQPSKEKDIIIGRQKYKVCGEFKDAPEIIASEGIKRIIIAQPDLSGPQLVSLTHSLQRYTRSILIVPDLAGMPVVGGKIEDFFNERILGFRTENKLANPANIIIKRAFDIIIGLIIFIFLIPVMIIIALAIRVDSHGKIIYTQERIGQNGRPFKCYKFRSMFNNSEQVLNLLLDANPLLMQQWEDDFKLKNDPRITRVGKFLRETSLDELPQIFNVIKGEMSLVGPRPVVEQELAKIGENIEEYFMVLPGMTGLWAVSGRSEIDYDERVQIETWYIRNWSLWLDISLLFQTIPAVLGRKGAY